MKITILGPGSVGLFWAYVLGSAGHEINLISRSRSNLEKIHFVSSVLGEKSALLERRVVPLVNDTEALKHVDCVLIAVKAAGLKWAANVLGAVFSEYDFVNAIYATNGLPWWIKKRLGLSGREISEFAELRSIHWGAVSSYVNTERRDDTVFHHAGLRLILDSQLEDNISSNFINSLLPLGFQTEIASDIEDILWEKLCGNAVISSLCALYDCSTAHLLSSSDYVERAIKCMGDLAEIGRASGFHVLHSPESRLNALKSLPSFIPSMVLDARSGRPLEVEELINVPLQLADLYGVPAPSLSELQKSLDNINN